MTSRFGLEIRAADAGDANGVAELMASCGASAPAAGLGDRLEALRHQPGGVMLALEWGPPSGLIAYHWYDAFDAKAPAAQITSLMVSPEARRRGVARALLKAAAQAARQAGCGDMHLLATPKSETLQAFCRATGFVEAGESFFRPLRKKG